MSEVPFADTERWTAMPIKMVAVPGSMTTANAEDQRTRNNVDWDDCNNHVCGLIPIEFNVIIDQNPVETKTTGGLHIPNEVQEKRMHMETRGTIVAMSPLAFSYDEWPEGYRKPSVGAKVAFVQHTGAFIDGQDGKKYRVVKDKDIVAVLR